jgi:hypothetical protein
VTPGSVLVDPNFRFRDGTTAKKILVVLNDGHDDSYVFVKTTSKPHSRGIIFGCQASDRLANFYLPKGTCPFLSECTWVCLDEYYEATKQNFLQRCMSHEIWPHGVLLGELTLKLLRCALATQDLIGRHGAMLTATIQRIENPAPTSGTP